MTLEEIESRVNEIRNAAGDDEIAHGLEDALRADFINHVATLGLPQLAAKARAVASTKDIEFQRWCA